MEDDKRWSEYRTILDRHEKAIEEVRESVKASISTITSRLVDQGQKMDIQAGRLDSIEQETMDQGEKMDRLVTETAGQSVILETIRDNLCLHKGQQEKQLNEQAAQLGENSGVLAKQAKVLDELAQSRATAATKMADLAGDVTVMKVAIEKSGTDMELVKKAVVQSPPQVWGKRVLYGLVAVAAIMICLTMIIRPDSIPLFLKFLEAHSTGH